MEAEIKRPKVIIEAVITRANGTVENLGIIAEQENLKEEQNNG